MNFTPFDNEPPLADQLRAAVDEAQKDLYEGIAHVLENRTMRDKRQARWERMITTGLGRVSRPFEGCAVMHVPVAATEIEKIKPIYYAAIRGGDSLFRFTGLDTSSTEAQDDAAYLFDDRLNYHSNFNKTILIWIAWCLRSGNSAIKVLWDPKKKQNDFTCIEPEFWVVPEGTEDMQDADWFVHIIQMSPSAYQRDNRFKEECRTDEYIAKIRGGKRTGEWRAQAKARREGLTWTNDPEVIVLWEIWERTKDGGWMFSTRSPVLWSGQVGGHTTEDGIVRDPVASPYRHGKLPVVLLPFELNEKDVYSPRGVPEITQHFEVAACKNWNDRLDSQTYLTRPVFFSNEDTPGASNITLKPGLIVPFPITKLDMGQISSSFGEEINFIGELVEARLQNFNWGVDQEQTQHHRTAFEVSQITQQSQMGNSVRVTLLRLALAELGFMAWENYRQFDRTSLDFIRNNELKQADPQVWDGKYRIEPGGSVDGSGKVQQIQVAMGNLEVAKEAPPGMLDYENLLGDFFSLQNPSARARYVIPSQQKAQSEAARQATELTDMKIIGFPVEPAPTDDHVVHLNTMVQYGQSCMAGAQPPPPPPFAVLMLKHGGAHVEFLKGRKDPPAQQAVQASQGLAKYLLACAQAGQGNILPMGTTGSPQTSPGTQNSPAGSPSAAPVDPKTAASIAQAVASMDKAGIPLSIQQINELYVKLGLSPLDGSSPILVDPGSEQKPQGKPVPMPAQGGAA